MNLRIWIPTSLAAMWFAAGWIAARAEEPARQRGTPIIFSEPKSDTVSSNLNQLEVKTSPFKGLESDLKKPFEIFDTGQSVGSFRPPAGLIAPPAASANNRRIKDLIDKRAELMLPGPDAGDPDLGDDDPFKSSEDKFNAAGKKLKTPLDRYYNRLDRERAALTNQVKHTDLIGNNKDSDSKDQFGRTIPDKPFGDDLRASVGSLGRLTNNPSSSGGLFSDQRKPTTFEELLGSPRPNEPGEHSPSMKESRLEEFKRLLDRPVYSPMTNSYSPAQPFAVTPPVPAPATPLPTWSSSPPSANPRDAFTSTAGLVGTPPQLQTLPSLAATTPSLNPPPLPVLKPKQPVTSFSIPKRQF